MSFLSYLMSAPNKKNTDDASPPVEVPQVPEVVDLRQEMEKKIRAKLEEEQRLYRELEESIRREMKEEELKEKIRAEEAEAKRIEESVRRRIQEEAEEKVRKEREEKEAEEKAMASRAAYVKQHNEEKVKPFVAYVKRITAENQGRGSEGVDDKQLEDILRSVLGELDTPALYLTCGMRITYGYQCQVPSIDFECYLVTESHVYRQFMEKQALQLIRGLTHDPTRTKPLTLLYTFQHPLSQDSMESKIIGKMCNHHWGFCSQLNPSYPNYSPTPLGKGSLHLFRDVIQTLPGKVHPGYGGW